MVKLGDQAPDFTLLSSTGERISLHEILRARKTVLLVFLRHLG